MTDTKMDDSISQQSKSPSPGKLESTQGSTPSSGGPPSNKKRQRATPEQLAILEETFLSNTSPNAKVREALAEKVKMSERSIQIWFQNRRAKVKVMQKRNHIMQEEALRARYLASLPGYGGGILPYRLPLGGSRYTPIRSSSYDPQIAAAARGQLPLQPNLRPLAINPAMRSFSLGGIGGAANGYDLPASISTLACQSLSIGTWRRIATSPMDLVCYYSASEKRFTYYINNNAAGFKIEFPFGTVENISFLINTSGVGQATFQVRETPTFYMEISGGGWRQCTDFTEGRQASHVNQHIILGDAATLRAQLFRLSQADQDMNKLVSFVEAQASMPPPEVPAIALQKTTASEDAQSKSVADAAKADATAGDSKPKPGTLDPKAAIPKHMHKRQRSRSNSAPLAIQLGLGGPAVDVSTPLGGQQLNMRQQEQHAQQQAQAQAQAAVAAAVAAQQAGSSGSGLDGTSLVRTQSFDAMNEDPTGLDTVKDGSDAAAAAAGFANSLRIDTSTDFLNMFRDSAMQHAIYSAGIAEGQQMFFGIDDGSMSMAAATAAAAAAGDFYSPFPTGGSEYFGGLDTPLLMNQDAFAGSVPQSPYITDEFNALNISSAAHLGTMTPQQLVAAGVMTNAATGSPMAVDAELTRSTGTDYVDMFTTVGHQLPSGDVDMSDSSKKEELDMPHGLAAHDPNIVPTADINLDGPNGEGFQWPNPNSTQYGLGLMGYDQGSNGGAATSSA